MMPIEIKEVIIKTTIEKEPDASRNGEMSREEFASLKRDILKSCEQMINKVFKQQTGR